jgi:hypothetical protein
MTTIRVGLSTGHNRRRDAGAHPGAEGPRSKGVPPITPHDPHALFGNLMTSHIDRSAPRDLQRSAILTPFAQSDQDREPSHCSAHSCMANDWSSACGRLQTGRSQVGWMGSSLPLHSHESKSGTSGAYRERGRLRSEMIPGRALTRLGLSTSTRTDQAELNKSPVKAGASVGASVLTSSPCRRRFSLRTPLQRRHRSRRPQARRCRRRRRR